MNLLWSQHPIGRRNSDGLGGTANLAVFGGNLPPSSARWNEESLSPVFRHNRCGLVARDNGQVARSTPKPIELVRPERRPHAGFSLVEVMIAILVLGIALVGLTQGITTALGSSKESELQTTAALFAAGLIEQLRAEGGITDGDADGDCGAGLELYRWTQSVEATKVEGLHEVTVTIESTRDGKTIYELKTLLFELPTDSADKNDSKKGGQR